MDPGVWKDMVHPGIPLLEKVLRPVLVYAFLVVGIRMAGKRELAQLNPFDLIVLLTLSNTVQNAIIGEDNSVVGGIVGAATLLLVNWMLVRFLYRHPNLERLVEGDPDVLIDGGTIDPALCRRNLITRAELETAAHKQGFDSLDEVERAVLEPGGTFTFVAKSPTPEEARHRALLARLDALGREVAALRAARA